MGPNIADVDTYGKIRGLHCMAFEMNAEALEEFKNISEEPA